MTERLYLLRHAKAGWAEPGMRDFDRALDETGRADALSIGLAMGATGYVPDLTLCSGARRARETLTGIAAHADTGRVCFLDALYTEDAAGYLELIKGHATGGSILVVGHNPMMEDLATALAGDGEESARTILAAGFPTAGLAVISASAGLHGLAPGKGMLEAFLTPAAA